MTHLRLIAPVPVPISVVPGAHERDPAAYARFWAEVADEVGAARALDTTRFSVQWDHAGQVQADSRYNELDTEALDRPFHVMTLRTLRPSTSDDAPLSDVEMRVYPHGVAVVECTLDLGHPPTEDQDAWLDRCQEQGIAAATRLAGELVADALAPVVDVAARRDRSGHVLVVDDDVNPTPLWVSRALVLAPEHRALSAHWTKDTVGEADDSERRELLEGTRDAVMRWVNYVFVTPDGPQALAEGEFASHWSGLRYAQVIYGSLDRIDSRLGHVLALASGPDSRQRLSGLRSSLAQLSNRAELIVLDQQSIAKYVSRPVRAHMDRLLEAWEFESLVASPVQFKVEMCHRQLDQIATLRQSRAGLVTDVILLGIAVTSIAGVALAISEFGRAAADSPGTATYDLGSSGFTQWLAMQPVDGILIASAAASSIVVALYIYFRRHSNNE